MLSNPYRDRSYADLVLKSDRAAAVMCLYYLSKKSSQLSICKPDESCLVHTVSRLAMYIRVFGGANIESLLNQIKYPRQYFSELLDNETDREVWDRFGFKKVGPCGMLLEQLRAAEFENFVEKTAEMLGGETAKEFREFARLV